MTVMLQDNNEIFTINKSAARERKRARAIEKKERKKKIIEKKNDVNEKRDYDNMTGNNDALSDSSIDSP